MASKKKPTKNKGTIEKFLIKKAREEGKKTEVFKLRINSFLHRIEKFARDPFP